MTVKKVKHTFSEADSTETAAHEIKKNKTTTSETIMIRGALAILLALITLLSMFTPILDAKTTNDDPKSKTSHDRIVETVDISNIEIPVRVFRGKTPVICPDL